MPKIWMLPMAALLQSCGPTSDSKSNDLSAEISNHAVPKIAEINVVASPDGGNRVHFTVQTNIPLPIEVMASVALNNQKDEDVYIGTDSERITLSQPKTEFDITTADVQGQPLPKGEYKGEVSFYPRWGALNDAAKHVPKTEGVSKPFALSNKSVTANQAQRRNEKRRWVMQNVIIGTPWKERRFVAELGTYEKYPSTLSHLHDAYYFSGPDMTLIVNRLKHEVAIWRDGKATE